MKLLLSLLPIYFAAASIHNPYVEEVKHLALKIEDDKKMKSGLWHTEGAAVMLYEKVKLLPPAPKANGAFFLSEAIHTEALEIGIKMTAQFPSRTDDYTESIPGFAIWFLHTAPAGFDGELFGHAPKFNGVGIFVYNKGNPQ